MRDFFLVESTDDGGKSKVNTEILLKLFGTLRVFCLESVFLTKYLCEKSQYDKLRTSSRNRVWYKIEKSKEELFLRYEVK